MVSHGIRWCQVVSDDVRWCQMVSDDGRWCQMVSEGVRGCQRVSDRASGGVFVAERAGLSSLTPSDTIWHHLPHHPCALRHLAWKFRLEEGLGLGRLEYI